MARDHGAAATPNPSRSGASRPGQPPKDFEFGLPARAVHGRWEIVRDTRATDGKALAQLISEYRLVPISGGDLHPVVAAECRGQGRAASRCGKADQACGVIVAPSMRATTTSRAPMCWRAMSVSIASETASAGTRDRRKRQDRVGRMAYADAARGRGRVHRPVQWQAYAHHRRYHPGLPRLGSGRVGLWAKADSVTLFDQGRESRSCPSGTTQLPHFLVQQETMAPRQRRGLTRRGR